MRSKRLLNSIFLLAVLFFGLIRIVNINWGSPYYFHPDERNVASAITKVINNFQENPIGVIKYESDFYAYGGLPIYLISILVSFSTKFTNQDPFELAIIWGRWISSFWFVVIVWMMYLIGKLIKPGKWLKSIILLTVTSFGWIQFSRYGTFEMWLTAFSLIYLYFCIKLLLTNRFTHWIFASFFLALSIATKIPSLVLVPLMFIAAFAFTVQNRLLKSLLHWLKISSFSFLSLLIVLTITLLFNPLMLNHYDYQIPSLSELYISTIYQLPNSLSLVIINLKNVLSESGFDADTILSRTTFNPFLELLNPDFVHSINVEGAIARGELKVFYTRHFNNTIPFVFQLFYIFPWLLSWPMVITGIVGTLLLTFRTFYTKNFVALIIIFWWLIQAIFVFSLFVKWTRYTIPLLPLLVFGAAWFWDWLDNLKDTFNSVFHRLLVRWGSIISWSFHYGMSILLIVTLFSQDPRIEASNWIKNNHIDRNWRVLSEVYDLGILPMNSQFNKIDLFNFYDLDDQKESEIQEAELYEKLEHYEVIIILSRRIWHHSMSNPKLFPKSYQFYNQLLSNKLNFTKATEFTNYPRFGPLVIFDEARAEETFSVFDRPRIQVFVRNDLINQLNINDKI